MRNKNTIATCVSLCFIYLASFQSSWAPNSFCHGQETANQTPQNPTANAEQSAQEIIERFAEALGGEMAISAIESLSMKKTYEGGTTAVGGIWYLNGKKLDKNIFNGKQEAKLFDGTQWWQWKRDDGEGKYIVECDYYNEGLFETPTDALRLLALVDELEVVPKSEYKDGPFAHCSCLRREVEGAYSMRFFDPDSGLLVHIDMKRNRDHEFTFSSGLQYNKIQNLLFVAVSNRSNSKGWKSKVTFTEIEIDSGVNELLFDPTVPIKAKE